MEKTKTFNTTPVILYLTVDHRELVSNLSLLFDFHWTKDNFEAILSSCYSLNIGLFVNNELNGFLLATALHPTASIELIAIHPQAQKQGLGMLLFQHFSEILKNRDFKEIELEVSEINTAHYFYEKMGFTVFNKRRNYYKDGSDALLMTHSLEDHSR